MPSAKRRSAEGSLKKKPEPSQFVTLETVTLPLPVVITAQDAITHARQYIEQVSIAIHGLARHTKDSNMELMLVELRAGEEKLRQALLNAVTRRSE